ncbi:MAG: hypothetical protein KME31_14960 [Tolypothrix carrinoi HA7290-LM1]|nr:hypothetical protein [Tolypothrix carrinoi HA7290-LM1]
MPNTLEGCGYTYKACEGRLEYFSLPSQALFVEPAASVPVRAACAWRRANKTQHMKNWYKNQQPTTNNQQPTTNNQQPTNKKLPS